VTRYSRWSTQAITQPLGQRAAPGTKEGTPDACGARKFSAERIHLKFMKQGTIAAGYFGTELLRALKNPAP
jgi:hypothetical protein